MQQLENNEKTDGFVDDDSLLAPLSQQIKPAESNHSQANVSQIDVHEDDSANSDDDLLNDFSMCFDSSQFLPDERPEYVRFPTKPRTCF